MDFPRITIITPSLNQGKFLEETILSVVGQGYPDLEYIIIDGGSSDNSIDIIQKYEQNITYWVSEPDTGQSNAINKGLRMASGQIVNWLNSDDVLAPGALEVIAREFEAGGEQTGVVFGGTMFFNKNGNISPDFGYDNPSLERYLSGIAFSQPSAFIRKTFLDKVGNLSDEFHFGMDYDLYSRLALVCSFRNARGKVLSGYRMHAGSKTVTSNALFIEEWIRIFIRMAGNINAKWVLSRLRRLEVFNEYLDSVEPFAFPFERVTVDQKKMLFYFLCYVLKSDYHNGLFERARVIRNYLVKNYGLAHTAREKHIGVVVSRLGTYPVFLIRLARQVKSLLQ